jgi:hypothetical protein
MRIEAMRMSPSEATVGLNGDRLGWTRSALDVLFYSKLSRKRWKERTVTSRPF